MSRKMAVTLIIILSLILSGLLFINYNMTRPTKLNKIIASKYNAPANSAFDDQNFYNCVVDKYNSNASKKISYTTNMSDTQLKSMDGLSCSNKKITSTKGIEKLTNLTELSVSLNQLTSIDVSNNINLTDLNVGNNQLTILDVSKNTNLTHLSVSLNQLTSLDVSKNPNLTYLDASYNQLTSLDVSRNTNLTHLYVDGNKLTSLDVSKNPNLIHLGVSSNQLTSLDVSKNTNLTYLSASYNQLTSLDVSKNPNLIELNVYENQLTNLDTNKNPNLKYLYAHINQLTSIDVSNNINLTDLKVGNNQLTSLDVSKNPNLTELLIWDNQLASLDVSKNVNLTDLDVSSNQITDLDVSNNINLTDLDISFNKLISPDVSKNLNLTDLDVSGNQLTSLDVSNNPNLTELNASYNQLTNLDVSKNVNLTKLYVPYNQITNLDVSKNANLEDLWIDDNQLTNLDTSKNANLEDLWIGDNQLTNLDVSKNVNLTKLYVHDNQLTNLDVSENVKLEKLNVNNNKLASLDVSKNINLTYLGVENNQLTSLDLSKNVNLTTLTAYNNPYNLGTISTVLGNKINVTKLITSDNIKLNSNMTKKFKAAYLNDVLQSVDENNNITMSKIGTYDYKIKFIVSLNGKEETITGTYTINVKDINLLSDKYKINNEKGYIYTGQDTDSNTILSNLKVDGEEATLEIKDNKVLIKNNNEVIREYKILNITKTDYDLSKEYIYTKITDFDISKITTNCELTNVNNTLEIGYDGEVFNIYKIVNIKSDYKIYGKWIYIVGEFDINKIIPTNATLTDNKGILEVKYNNEVIDSLTELKIDFGSLKVTKDKIVPGEIKEYTEFMKNIKSDNLGVKLYKGTTLITEGNIEEGMTLKVISSEYGEIMTYTITKEYVDVSKLEIDEKNYIKKYNVGTTYEEIRKEIDTSGSVKFIDNTGKELENSDIIRTGSKVVIELSTETKEYTIVVYGDINGDGKITMSDLVKSANYLIDETIISEDCYKEAIDVTKDGNVRMSDIIKLSNILIGSN